MEESWRGADHTQTSWGAADRCHESTAVIRTARMEGKKERRSRGRKERRGRRWRKRERGTGRKEVRETERKEEEASVTKGNVEKKVKRCELRGWREGQEGEE